MPFETEEDHYETKKLINKIAIDMCSHYVNVVEQEINDVEPYSPWALNPEKYGIKLELKTIDNYIRNSKGFRDLV